MAEYNGKEVELEKPFRLPQGSDKKFGVYVKNPETGNIIKVTFGDPKMSIKRDSPERRKAFRSRHDCENKKDKTTPGYWSCLFWDDENVSDLLENSWVEKFLEYDGKAKQYFSKMPVYERQSKENSEYVYISDDRLDPFTINLSKDFTAKTAVGRSKDLVNKGISIDMLPPIKIAINNKGELNIIDGNARLLTYQYYNQPIKNYFIVKKYSDKNKLDEYMSKILKR